MPRTVSSSSSALAPNEAPQRAQVLWNRDVVRPVDQMNGPLGFAHGAAAGPHDQQPQAHKPPPATGWEPAGTGAVGACRGIGAAQPTALQAGCAVAPLPLSLFSGAARYLRP